MPRRAAVAVGALPLPPATAAAALPQHCAHAIPAGKHQATLALLPVQEHGARKSWGCAGVPLLVSSQFCAGPQGWADAAAIVASMLLLLLTCVLAEFAPCVTLLDALLPALSPLSPPSSLPSSPSHLCRGCLHCSRYPRHPHVDLEAKHRTSAFKHYQLRNMKGAAAPGDTLHHCWACPVAAAVKCHHCGGGRRHSPPPRHLAVPCPRRLHAGVWDLAAVALNHH